MLKIVIVEDEPAESKVLKQHIEDYAAKNGETAEIMLFDNGITFIEKYKADADIVFMDIKMPNITGMETAQRLRKIDNTVILVFVTDMVQYAVQGYSVGALDFIVKPVSYAGFNGVMNRAAKVLASRDKNEIVLKNSGVIRRVPIEKIKYIEVSRHRLTYHTEDGNFEGWGTLDALEKTLPGGQFSRCNVGYLVGLKHILSVEDNEVVIGSDRLKISRMRKKEFLTGVAQYLGRTV